ncbi:NADH:ubiquinone oxidoreductase subunit B-like Fe-S oxidoreductase [Bradyrhizobium sp. USDA 326]|uniref:hypothetical protein n=1 Tax=unclassified Bradyrhizobium TaxID=2631580 RepID=UPI0013151940|nr:hypothetical protein [Bradyrhizobium sp. RP6]
MIDPIRTLKQLQAADWVKDSRSLEPYRVALATCIAEMERTVAMFDDVPELPNERDERR